MNETIDDLTIAYSDEGTETIKELDKHILTRGAWTTIMFKYQEWDKAKQVFGPVKYSIRRFQKRNNQFWLKSKFTISSDDQARKMIEVLNGWMGQAE
jgi:hypothetical protein